MSELISEGLHGEHNRVVFVLHCVRDESHRKEPLEVVAIKCMDGEVRVVADLVLENACRYANKMT